MTTTALNKIDDEWQNFISSKYNNDDDEASEDLIEEEGEVESIVSADIAKGLQQEAPRATDIYISTKSKIAYLNQPIDLKTLFWGIKVMPYSTPANGVIKKQMKYNPI